MFYYYTYKNKILFSKNKYKHLENINEKTAKKSDDIIYFLNEINPHTSRKSFSVSHPSLLFINNENLNLLTYSNCIDTNIPNWILQKIQSRAIVSINTKYSDWKKILNLRPPQKWRINIIGLGDVGSMLLVGLRLLGGKYISNIGIYSRSNNKIKRWEFEANQITAPFVSYRYPEIHGVNKEKLFDCDMFVFCASCGVPPINSNIDDVRMYQLKGNSKIITEYAKMARNKNYKGIFAVVSDPVDLLSKVVLLESNKDDSGTIDFNGLSPEQIQGYGLGVMNARANFYDNTSNYKNEGRAYGPHGEGLVIANSIKNYNNEYSKFLTQKALKANTEVRKTGYKPYIAPALSSGSLSIIQTIKGDWHYSSVYMGGVFMGCKNRLNYSGIEIEKNKFPKPLLKRINNSYKRLKEIL